MRESGIFGDIVISRDFSSDSNFTWFELRLALSRVVAICAVELVSSLLEFKLLTSVGNKFFTELPDCLTIHMRPSEIMKFDSGCNRSQ
jgi:hypothetical protein